MHVINLSRLEGIEFVLKVSFPWCHFSMNFLLNFLAEIAVALFLSVF